MQNVIQSGLPGRRDRPTIELIEDFLADYRSEGKSPATIRSYGADLRAFAAGFKGGLDAVTLPALKEYMPEVPPDKTSEAGPWR